MNYAIFAGRLGRNAELKPVGEQQVLNFSVAVDVGWGDRKETLWVGCALWGERGAKLAPYLTKGKSVTVGGDLSYRTWQTNTGGTGVELTLNVQRLTLQGGGENASSDRQTAPRSEPAPQQREIANTSGTRPALAPDFDDDIPF